MTIANASTLEAQQFGAYAAGTADEILISEPFQSTDPATVYRYRRTATGAWEEVGTMTAPAHEGGDYFGRFVQMDEQSLLIGGTTMDQSTGAVWVYRRNGAEWEFVELMRPEGAAEGDSFGRFGLLHGDFLFVSALGANESRGAVWVFQRGAEGRWVEEAKLVPGEDAAESEFFGWSLAFNGERLMTGALQAGGELQNRGAAYIFRRNGPGDWVLEARLALDEEDSEPGDTFGFVVAWLDGKALIGVPGRDGGIGEIRSYQLDGEAWLLSATLSAFEREAGGRFGSSMAVAPEALWVGSPGARSSGVVFRFAREGAAVGGGPSSIGDGGNSFGSVQTFTSPAGDVGDSFGGNITLVEGVVVVASTGDDFGLGSVTILERNDAGWAASEKLVGPVPASLAALVDGEISCADGQADQFECNQVAIASFLPVSAIGGGRGAKTNDVWGWTDSESGKEYAIVGRTDGTAFIDVSNPSAPVYLGNLPKTPGSRGNAWRDIKVYDNHAFIVADGAGQHGMQVFDLTKLRSVMDAPVTFEEDAHYDGIASAHNIVINEETGYAYAVGVNSGGETCGGGLHMINVQQPTHPVFEGCFSDTTSGNSGTGYSHDAMCVIYQGPDTKYVGKEICFGSNENKLSIADVSDKANPTFISSASYPNVAYAHQGWVTEDHKYFFMNDEGDENNAVQAEEPLPGTRTLIWDIQDLDDPLMVKEHFGETFTIDHNLYIKGNLMYQSNYVSGLRILDISDPENPTEVGFLDTVPWSEEVEFDGSWSNYPYFESGTIVVSSGREGVFFLKYRPVDLVP